MKASSATAAPLSFAEANVDRFVRELTDLVRIPSIGSDARHAADVRRCAQWIASHLAGLGIADVRLLPTAGHPLVFAATPPVPGRPVVMVYGHYDVQPPGPIAAWQTPPFRPARRGAWLFGRGASDDKGQLFAHIKALESWIRSGGPPVGVKLLFEGEEEIGSPSLAAALRAYRSLLGAHVVMVSDSPMPAPGRPAITTALRGSLGFEIEVRGAREDLHSGIFGGAIPDPIEVLCHVIATLGDRSGRITVSRFYDAVREVSSTERRALAATGPSDQQLLSDARAQTGWGERNFTLFEKTTIRPSLTVTGIRGGHTGPGDRTVLAASARARVNVRLVPNQRPDDVARLLARHMARVMPASVRATLRFGRSTRPYQIAREHPMVRAAMRACRKGFGAPAALLPMGGSVAAVPAFQDVLGIPSVLVGFGLPDDGKHGPNERFYLPTFRRAVATSIHFLAEVA